MGRLLLGLFLFSAYRFCSMMSSHCRRFSSSCSLEMFCMWIEACIMCSKWLLVRVTILYSVSSGVMCCNVMTCSTKYSAGYVYRHCSISLVQASGVCLIGFIDSSNDRQMPFRSHSMYISYVINRDPLNRT